jgi:adenosylcobinamide-phosphate synthase
MEWLVLSVFLGFLIDLLLGERGLFMHPIRVIGLMISYGEKILRKRQLHTSGSQFIAGAILAILVILISYLVPFMMIGILEKIHPLAGWVLNTYLCYQILATRSLKTESMKVHAALIDKDVEKARRMLSYIVGRDTVLLNEERIVKATVETVAENTSDGVIAPMIYMLIGGAPLGLLYKAINTLDSMIGYQNEKYQYFGKFAARLDDVANYFPSRITAILMIMSCYFCRLNGKEAIRIFRRDRWNHKSPNSGQTESVCAGALCIQLGGTNSYFGKTVIKKTIGDDRRSVNPDDIAQANLLMLTASWMAIVLLSALRILAI